MMLSGRSPFLRMPPGLSPWSTWRQLPLTAPWHYTLPRSSRSHPHHQGTPSTGSGRPRSDCRGCHRGSSSTTRDSVTQDLAPSLRSMSGEGRLSGFLPQAWRQLPLPPVQQSQWTCSHPLCGPPTPRNKCSPPPRCLRHQRCLLLLPCFRQGRRRHSLGTPRRGSPPQAEGGETCPLICTGCCSVRATADPCYCSSCRPCSQ
mmetsp:Transcript_25561/g.54307  ORF Transcript_25561/g.54307 Transcript_25561/m.54307 type:complete len:202 (+) Transcript_25561:1941-2546(+)